MHNKIYEQWLKSVREEQKQELIAIKGKEKEIIERFCLPLAFGTAGMRGEVGMGTFRMNEYTVKRATLGLGRFICSLGEDAKQKGVVISYDTRRFSFEFAMASAKVLSGLKIKAYIFEDVRPVPMCSYAIRKLGAVAGIMITASHNPKEYNGYKVYGDDGAQMSPENTEKVVKFIDEIEDYFNIPEDSVETEEIKGKDNIAINKYITVIGKSLDESYYQEIEKLTLSPEEVKKHGKNIKLVYTPIHGSGYKPVTAIFERMGINASIVEQQKYPDTEFSTVSVPNPENADALKLGIELGNQIGADVVMGTDPDCDRMGIAVRNTSNNEFTLLNGNQIGVLLLDYILSRLKDMNKLPHNGAIVKTIVTTTLADKIAESFGIKVFDVLTGFKFIGEKIKEWEQTKEYTFIFGYEESYGYLRGTHARDKDAVVASMLTAEMVCYYESKGLSLYDRLMEIYQKYGYYCEENSSIVYKGVEGMKTMSEVMQRLRQTQLKSIAGEEIIYTADYNIGKIKYSGGGEEDITLPKTNALYYALKDKQFICIRPSGTEPKLKIYVLCRDTDAVTVKQKAQKIMAAVKDIL
ncbi:MAG: phospho-sugar mutase [Christensenellales bacterium]|jgi:phosphoglucomutase|nr:phospho-sugar mutase [Clostridiales bacterium]